MSTLTDADRLARIRARAEAATPGPWRVMGEGSEGSRIAPDTGDARADSRWLGIMNGRVQPEDGRNARFIAHARTDIPALLAAVERVLVLCNAAERSPTASPWIHVNDVRDAIEGGAS